MQEGSEEAGGSAEEDRGSAEGGRGSRKESEEIDDDMSFEEWYHEIAVNCFRYFDMRSLAEVDHLTLKEYEWLIEAKELRDIDRERDMHWLAYLNFVASAKKESGNKLVPVHKTFKHFFDYKKELKRVEERYNPKKKDNRFEGVAQIIKRQKGG